MPKTVFANTFLQEYLAAVARLGAAEAVVALEPPILGEAHHIHVGPFQLRDVPQLAYHTLFSMVGGATGAGEAASGSVAIRGGGDDLAAFHDGCEVELGGELVAETLGPRVFQELFQEALDICVEVGEEHSVLMM